MTSRWAALLAAAAVVVSACAGDGNEDATSAVTSDATTTSAPAPDSSSVETTAAPSTTTAPETTTTTTTTEAGPTTTTEPFEPGPAALRADQVELWPVPMARCAQAMVDDPLDIVPLWEVGDVRLYEMRQVASSTLTGFVEGGEAVTPIELGVVDRRTETSTDFLWSMSPTDYSRIELSDEAVDGGVPPEVALGTGGVLQTFDSTFQYSVDIATGGFELLDRADFEQTYSFSFEELFFGVEDDEDRAAALEQLVELSDVELVTAILPLVPELHFFEGLTLPLGRQNSEDEVQGLDGEPVPRFTTSTVALDPETGCVLIELLSLNDDPEALVLNGARSYWDPERFRMVEVALADHLESDGEVLRTSRRLVAIDL